MRTALATFLLLISFTCFAETVQTGNFIVVRGAVLGCEAWDKRILDIVEISHDEGQTIVGISGVKFVGSDLAEIEAEVLGAIENNTGVRPKTLTFELIESVLDIKPLIDPYLYSTRALDAGFCPPRYDLRIDRKIPIEEQIEELRREELSRSVV